MDSRGISPIDIAVVGAVQSIWNIQMQYNTYDRIQGELHEIMLTPYT